MNILMAASEMVPFARTGALAEVMLALPGALREAGHEVSVVLPYYRSIKDAKEFSVRPTKVKFTVPVGEARYDCEIFESRAPNGVQVFFVGRDEFFDRSGLYGTNGRDYQDNAARFTFFNKCVIELARRLNPAPDVIHAHDWQAALLPVLAKQQGMATPVVLTVHDLAFQGNFWSYDFGLTNLTPDYFSARGLEFFGSMNFLKGGILFANRVTLPSERFVREAQTKEFGCGLDAVLREQAGKLVGVPDGLDERTGNPGSDLTLAGAYSAGDLTGKAACRAQLLSDLKLDANPKGPIFALSSRLVQQKGFELLLPIVDRLLSADVRLVLLGTCPAAVETELRGAVKKHSTKLAWIPNEEEAQLRKVLAGADIILAPAPVEPIGLGIRQALRYGALPVARAAGGLSQFVQDFDPSSGAGNGFVFYSFQPDALLDAARRASEVFANSARWEKLVGAAMATDFSWKASAAQLEGLYEQLLGRRALAA